MSVEGTVLDKQRNDRFIIGHLAGVVQSVTIVGSQIGTGLNEQPNNVLMPPEPCVEYGPPAVLIIGINGGGIGSDQCTYRVDVSSPTRFVDRCLRHWVC